MPLALSAGSGAVAVRSTRPFDGLGVILTVPLDALACRALAVRVGQAGALRMMATDDRVDGSIGAGAGASTVVICKDQSSTSYAVATAAGCVVANMQWLLDVLASGVRTDPGADIRHRVCPVLSAAIQALVRPGPAATLTGQVITVGSYREIERERAVQLIAELGAVHSGAANASTCVYVLAPYVLSAQRR